jgi:hypothetical protein
MATDKSEPRVGVIAQVAVVSIVTLVAVHAALVAYFDRTSYEEEMRKVVATPEALVSVRASEKERLSSGSMPIDKAMQQLVSKGRINASPDIVPTASRDVSPLQGWTKMPGFVPTAMTAVLPPPPVPSASAAPSSSSAPGPSGAPAQHAPTHPPAGGPKPAGAPNR